METVTKGNRQTSGESASLPQYLIISLSNFRPKIIYFHSSQWCLIPYLHQRPIFFKANSIHSSIVAILELIRRFDEGTESAEVATSVTKGKQNRVYKSLIMIRLD
jgi:hypothetical protein